MGRRGATLDLRQVLMMTKATTVKTVTVVLAAVMASSMAGCGVTVGDGSGSSTDTKATVAESTGESSVAPTAAVTPDEPATEPSAAGRYGGDVESLLTPQGATVVAASSGELVLMSTDSVDSLAAFYEDALDQLGAQRSDAANVGSAWGYNGTYDGGRDIQVAVVEAGGTRSIAISY